MSPRLNSPEEEEYVHEDDSGRASAVLLSETNKSHGTSFNRVAATAKSLLQQCWVAKTQAVQVSTMKHSVSLKRLALIAIVCVNLGLLAKSGFHDNKETDIDPVGSLARIEEELQQTRKKLHLEIRQQEQIIKSTNDRIVFLKKQVETSRTTPSDFNETEQDEIITLQEKYDEIRDTLNTSARNLRQTISLAMQEDYSSYCKRSKCMTATVDARTFVEKILSLVKEFDTWSETCQTYENEADQWKTETAKLVRRIKMLEQQKSALYIFVVLNVLLGLTTWCVFGRNKKALQKTKNDHNAEENKIHTQSVSRG